MHTWQFRGDGAKAQQATGGAEMAMLKNLKTVQSCNNEDRVGVLENQPCQYARTTQGVTELYKAEVVH